MSKLPNHKWTEEEREIVRREYKGNNRSADIIGTQLGVTKYAVKGQAAKMGILMPKSPPWTEKEIESLEEMIHRYSTVQVAKKLHRSINAVALKAKRLKLNRRLRDDWYTKVEVCEVCGVDHRRVQHWIDSGALKASYHNGIRPSKYGMAMWHIEATDLKQFLLNYSGELVGRNVDIQQIVWIIAE
jgi:hypothetical protein